MRAALPAVCVLVLVLAGCGGSGGGDASWGQRADAICDRAEQAIRKLGAPEDTADLARVTARASAEVRAATGEIRKLEASEEERRRAKPFLADLDVVERSLERLGEATATRRRRQIEKAARALRLDAVDVAVHAQEAGLTRCGREKLGVAASDTVLATTFAEWLARRHMSFLLAEGMLARHHDPEGPSSVRSAYWRGLWDVVERADEVLDPNDVVPPESTLESAQHYYEVFGDMKDAADYLNTMVRGERALSDGSYTEDEGRRLVQAYKAAIVPTLEQLGPAGKAQLRALEGVGRNLHAPEGQPS